MKKFLFICLLFIVALNHSAFSQSGMKFAEFMQRLDPYFDKALIEDIRKQLPQGTDYTIWGWDVGDFSGDGFYDVAFGIRLAGDRTRRVQAYMFADIDGFLRKVGQFDYSFVDIPMEVGFVIKNKTCFITQKYKQFNWSITGYTFDNGILMKRDEFVTKKLGELTRETYTNYINSEFNDRYILTKNGDEKLNRTYCMIPSYYRGKLIYKGYTGKVTVSRVENVPEGAYYWSGDDDLSYEISSAYDDENMYFTLKVNDDQIVVQKCDTCIADFMDVWINVNEFGVLNDSLGAVSGTKISFQNKADSGIYKLSIYPGNFTDIPAYVKVSTNDELDVSQKADARSIRAISNYTDKGYVVKFKIPFSTLGIDFFEPTDSKFYQLGFTVSVTDYDNEFRPEEYTVMTSSPLSPFDPSTYGKLIIVPREQWWGESSNIYNEDIIRNLLDYGF